MACDDYWSNVAPLSTQIWITFLMQKIFTLLYEEVFFIAFIKEIRIGIKIGKIYSLKFQSNKVKNLKQVSSDPLTAI